MKLNFFFLILIIPLFFSGCFFKDKNKVIDISQAEQISSIEKWAVVTDSYVALKADAGNSGTIISHARKGDIFQIKGNKIVSTEKNKNDIWYKLENGWLPEKSIRIFSNKLQAEFFSNK